MRAVLHSVLAMSDMGEGWIGHWIPGNGDSSVVGSITVLSYLLAAYLCWRVLRRAMGAQNRRAIVDLVQGWALLLWALTVSARRVRTVPIQLRFRALWSGITMVLVLLAINKQLDLQTAFTEAARAIASSGGWYDARRDVQIGFMSLVLLAGLWTLRTSVLLSSGTIPRGRWVLVGIVFLICFVSIRSVSHHDIDHLIGMKVGGLYVNWILEVGGIGIVICGALGVLAAKGPSEPSRTGERPS